MHKLFKIPMLPSSNNNNQSPQSRLQQIPTSNNNNSPQLSILTPDNQYLNSKISPLSSCSLTLR